MPNCELLFPSCLLLLHICHRSNNLWCKCSSKLVTFNLCGLLCAGTLFTFRQHGFNVGNFADDATAWNRIKIRTLPKHVCAKLLRQAETFHLNTFVNIMQNFPTIQITSLVQFLVNKNIAGISKLLYKGGRGVIILN